MQIYSVRFHCLSFLKVTLADVTMPKGLDDVSYNFPMPLLFSLQIYTRPLRLIQLYSKLVC